MIEPFNHVIYLTLMMAFLTGLYYFVFKQNTIPIVHIWCLVLGAWIGDIIVSYILK